MLVQHSEHIVYFFIFKKFLSCTERKLISSEKYEKYSFKNIYTTISFNFTILFYSQKRTITSWYNEKKLRIKNVNYFEFLVDL